MYGGLAIAVVAILVVLELRRAKRQQQLADASVAEIDVAMDHYALLVFRDQPLTEGEQIELAKRFGVRSTPCAVWTGRSRHRGTGAAFPWKELIRCD